MDTRELVDDFLASKSPNTLDAYRRDLADFQRFLEVENGEDATRILLGNGPGNANILALRYKTSMTERGLSPRTINRRLSALRSLVSLARRFGLVTWSLEVDGVKVKAYRDTRGPAVVTVQRLLDIATGDTPKCRRDVAILRLLFDLGLRRGEVAGLDVADIDLGGATLAVRGKGESEKSFLSVPPPTCQALSLWLEKRETEGGPLFTNFDRAGKSPQGRLSGTSIYRLVRDLGQKAGVKAWPHGIRHTSITTALQVAQAQGYQVETVQDFSRHADIRTVLIYRDKDNDYQGQIAGLVAGELE
jgi:integrase/recombinase XerC